MSATRHAPTLFPPATPASPSATPGSAAARRITAGSGRKCAACLSNAGPAGSLVRTLLATSRWASMACWLTWKPKTTKRGRLYFQLAPSVPRTAATGFGLLPTPTTDSRYDRRKPYAQGGLPLSLAVRLLPTPLANDAANQTLSPSRLHKAKAPGLTAALHQQLHPTPPVQSQSTPARHSGDLLNPRFVLEMMGFPPDWCDLTEAEMQQVRKQLRTTRPPTRSTGPETL